MAIEIGTRPGRSHATLVRAAVAAVLLLFG
jgi:hypothetical protein